MPEFDEDQTFDATEEQVAALRDLGVKEPQLEGLTSADADELIAELRALREDAGRVGRD